MQFTYHVVDVFTESPLEGNALAVVVDAAGMDSRVMQRVAREFNLSETSFILPQERGSSGTRVRIFTPAYEMLFAGHPTIGTAHVMRECGIVPKDADSFVLSENIGPVAVRVERGSNPRIWLTTPPIEKLGAYPRDRCAAALSLSESDLLDAPCELLSAGNPNVFVAVKSPAVVDSANLNAQLYLDMVADRDGTTCMFVFAPTASGAYSRMFAPELGVVEDPATGSATGPLAAFMIAHGLFAGGDGTTFVSEQGTKMGRRSLLHVLVRGKDIEVGGYVTPVARGVLSI
jgi:trans-2,3-dihydro-3-hydroxyanthranilate isomerase